MITGRLVAPFVEAQARQAALRALRAVYPSCPPGAAFLVASEAVAMVGEQIEAGLAEGWLAMSRFEVGETLVEVSMQQVLALALIYDEVPKAGFPAHVASGSDRWVVGDPAVC